MKTLAGRKGGEGSHRRQPRQGAEGRDGGLGRDGRGVTAKAREARPKARRLTKGPCGVAACLRKSLASNDRQRQVGDFMKFYKISLFSNWDLNPNISDQTFVLSAPEGYTQAKFVDMQPEH